MSVGRIFQTRGVEWHNISVATRQNDLRPGLRIQHRPGIEAYSDYLGLACMLDTRVEGTSVTVNIISTERKKIIDVEK